MTPAKRLEKATFGWPFLYLLSVLMLQQYTIYFYDVTFY